MHGRHLVQEAAGVWHCLISDRPHMDRLHILDHAVIPLSDVARAQLNRVDVGCRFTVTFDPNPPETSTSVITCFPALGHYQVTWQRLDSVLHVLHSGILEDAVMELRR